MREVTYSCSVTCRNGVIVPLPADETAEQQRKSFLHECAQILQDNPGMKKVNTRCTLKIISGRKAWRDSVRSSYFAFIRDCLDRGRESFTCKYTTEKTIKQMERLCHENLKLEYCVYNPDHYSTIHVRFPDGHWEDVQTYFTLSDRTKGNEDLKLRRLNDEEFRTYVIWAKAILEEASGVTYTGISFEKKIA